MAHKKMFIGGNWKCNGTQKKIKELVKLLNGGGSFPENAEVVVAPTALHVQYVVENLRKDISVSVQNIWTEPKEGAWTGELTPDLVKDIGVHWTILGHSERRKFNEESPELVAKKCVNALNHGLSVIACIGETLEERESGNTMKVCISQLEPILAAIKPEDLSRVVLAYEPVWAIGTGKTATPLQAQETHADIRGYLEEKIGAPAASSLRIIYGGSVKGSNCSELMLGKDIDGFLVGGASLQSEFLDIIKCAKLKAKI